jgi:signal transduction histidine kinase
VSDAAELDALLARARAGYHTDAAEAEGLVQEVLRRLSPDDALRRAEARVILGSVAFVRGDLGGAVALAHEALGDLQGAPPTSSQCEAHLLLGAAARRRGDSAAAAHHARLALEGAVALGDADTEIVARNNLGLALADGQDPDGAMENYLAALDGFDRVSDGLAAQLRGSLLNNIALAHRMRGDHAAAATRFAAGRQAALDAGNRREAVRIGRNLATSLLRVGRADEAVEVLDAVAAEARQIGDAEVLLALAEVCLGRAHLAREEPEAAVEPLQQGLRRLQALGHHTEKADLSRAACTLSAALRACGRADEALAVVDEALLAVPTHLERHHHALLLERVDALEVLGRHAEALSALRTLRTAERAWQERVLADQAQELRHQLEFRERQREADRLRREQERLEAVVDERTAELRAARDLARSADRAKTAFLAVASHELRTPLNAIVGYAELVSDGLGEEEPEMLRDDLQSVLAAAEVLTQHVDRILAMANLEAGTKELRLATVTVDGLLDDVAARSQRQLASAANTLEREVEPGLRLRTDPGLLRALLDELTQNAAKFTSAGLVVLRAYDDLDEVVFEVEDDGPGIAPDELDRIFEPFGQRDDSYTREHGGLGLGLTLCQRYCMLLGGQLAVRSAPGEGAVFEVRLPVAGPDDVGLDGPDSVG